MYGSFGLIGKENYTIIRYFEVYHIIDFGTVIIFKQ